MADTYILYNPLAGNGQGAQDAELLDVFSTEDLRYCNMTKFFDYKAFFAGLSPEDRVVLCGGDGTLNRFINALDGTVPSNEIWYLPCGSGNDFAFDLGHKSGDMPFLINEYLRDLPCVYVKGKRYRFLNGIGFGIDGYCCEVGDEIRRTSDKPVNYTTIAIKGLLFHYKPTRARVTVDGVTHLYDKVWIAPTMNGRFYGGGMMPTPEQTRNREDGKLSAMVMHGAGRLRTLMLFPSIFKGTHIRNRKLVHIRAGHEITVRFDRPVALQIDGETILDVTEYTAVSGADVSAQRQRNASSSLHNPTQNRR